MRGFDFNVDEIREDVATEVSAHDTCVCADADCSQVQQYGQITHIFVDSASAGNVYLKMTTVDVSEQCARARVFVCVRSRE
jgi:hypothetical protein